ncbi:MAG: MaoC family dehydratase N-terminal domain-containing protein [Chloroflexi bacterium]|nr:MaoC family dehydratase N-terminal domain-containing protein [Chloroflexota bacterium]
MAEGKITDEAVAELRKRLGGFIRLTQFNEYATRDTIRHYARGIGDANPLWCDDEYAKKSRWGGIIAPPGFLYSVYWTAGRAGGLPGVHGFHSGNEWNWLRVINEGDRIKAQEQFTDIVEKAESEYAGKTVIQYTETTYRNQRTETIAKCKGWQIRAERKAGREKGKYSAIKTHHYSQEELEAIYADYDKEEVRGGNPRWWEDVKEGEPITHVVKGPLTVTDIICWYVGQGGTHNRALKLALEYYRRHPAVAYQDPVTGVPDTVQRVHWDSYMAQQIGMPNAYDVGSQRISFFTHLMTNWQGDDSFLRSLNVTLRRFNYVGDTQWLKGKVVRKYEEKGEYKVDCEVWAENQRGEITAPGHATVVLPSRLHGPVVLPAKES